MQHPNNGVSDCNTHVELLRRPKDDACVHLRGGADCQAYDDVSRPRVTLSAHSTSQMHAFGILQGYNAASQEHSLRMQLQAFQAGNEPREPKVSLLARSTSQPLHPNCINPINPIGKMAPVTA